MKVLVTGSAGLIGSACVDLWAGQGHSVIGVDCDGRKKFFGPEGSIAPTLQYLKDKYPSHRYEHSDINICDRDRVEHLIFEAKPEVVIHCAGQPSHDYSGKFPFEDWDVNATGTVNMLEAVRRYVPDAMFIFTSTNKVYGDAPNHLKYTAVKDRWVPDPDQVVGLTNLGFTEELNPDDAGPCTRTPFGASKMSADLMVQEYARYFGMRTAVFRLGCVTGASHAAVELHGFLAYLARCVVSGTEYKVFGYGGRQVRDNIHAKDVALAFEAVVDKKVNTGPYVYNMGGGLDRSVSVLEAHKLLVNVVGKDHQLSYVESPRVADHQWWVTDTRLFSNDYPWWRPTFSFEDILEDVVTSGVTTR